MTATRSPAKNWNTTLVKRQTARIVKRPAKVVELGDDATVLRVKFSLKAEFQRSKKKLHKKTQKEERGGFEAFNEYATLYKSPQLSNYFIVMQGWLERISG
jgi:hypothetical protein